jgi:hypothetical protein
MHGAIIPVPLLLAWFLWVVAAPGSFYFSGLELVFYPPVSVCSTIFSSF